MNIFENRLDATVEPINAVNLDTDLNEWMDKIEDHLEYVLSR